MTLQDLLAGRSILRCECGTELFVEEVRTDDGLVANRLIPCKCGSEATVQIPPGSILGGFSPALMSVWGPVKN